MSALLDRMADEATALRESAAAMNSTYSHSGLTDPRADRLTTRADAIMYVVDTFRRELGL